MSARLLAIGLSAIITLAGCTSQAPVSESATTSVSDEDVETTTTTAAPIVLATAANLGLPIGQCWDELAVATTTTLAPGLTTADGVTTTTSPATTQTTTPHPQVVAIVDCNGTNKGEIYSSFCIGLDPDSDEEVESASGAQISDLLELVPCPGDSELLWPGDRELRRAAARVCLNVFVGVFAEPYATSDRVAREITPNEGLWERGERRVVCSATQPPEPTPTATEP